METVCGLRVIITYKNFPVSDHVSHIGLGVSALNIAKSLRQIGIAADVWPILSADELSRKIAAAFAMGENITHVIIAAPWLPTLQLQAKLVFRFTNVRFVVICHSNVGFLAADPDGILKFRQALDLEQGAFNFTAAGNSVKFCQWIEEAYRRPCTPLPNLYFLGDRPLPHHHPVWNGGVLRIGLFGAVRPLKNMLTGAAAAIDLAAHLKAITQLHISGGRSEGGQTVLNSLYQLTAGIPGFEVITHPWAPWPQFRQVIRSMHLLFQVSYTESFNMVTADGAAESVPAVVSDAIEWAPSHWKANVDNATEVSRVARCLVRDPEAGAEGFCALQRHNQHALHLWKRFLVESAALHPTVAR